MKRFIPFLIVVGIFFSSCEQPNDTSTINNDSPIIGVLKETTGTFLEGDYSVSIKQTYDSLAQITQRACVYSLERNDNIKCGFILMKNIKPSETTYQVYLKIESPSVIFEEDYNTISLQGNVNNISLLGAIEDIGVDEFGNYEYYILANINDINLTNLKNQTQMTITLTGDKSLSFTIVFDWFYYLMTYL